jgi:hypothetical protein
MTASPPALGSRQKFGKELSGMRDMGFSRQASPIRFVMYNTAFTRWQPSLKNLRAARQK